jgi:hypothetical protein
LTTFLGYPTPLVLVARTEFLVVVSVQLTVVYGPTTQGIRDPDRLDPAQVASRIVHVEKLFGQIDPTLAVSW